MDNLLRSTGFEALAPGDPNLLASRIQAHAQLAATRDRVMCTVSPLESSDMETHPVAVAEAAHACTREADAPRDRSPGSPTCVRERERPPGPRPTRWLLTASACTLVWLAVGLGGAERHRHARGATVPARAAVPQNSRARPHSAGARSRAASVRGRHARSRVLVPRPRMLCFASRLRVVAGWPPGCGCGAPA